MSDKQYKILVVEDNEVDQMVIQQILENSGYYCVVAGDSQTAKDAVAAEEFDLGIIDLTLPNNESGLMLSEELGLPYLILTANSDPSFIYTAKEKGAISYINKPVSESYLLAQLLWALEHIKENPGIMGDDKGEGEVNGLIDKEYWLTTGILMERKSLSLAEASNHLDEICSRKRINRDAFCKKFLENWEELV